MGLANMPLQEDREHVTTFFRRRAEAYRVRQLVAAEDYAGGRLAVDSLEDLEMARRVVGCMEQPHYTYDLSKIVKIYRTLWLETRDKTAK